MFSNDISFELNLREYCNIPSILLRELKGLSKLPKTASDIWLILYDLCKFDLNKEVKVSIKKLCTLVARERRTVESHLQNLEKLCFIKKVANYSKFGSQLINTYKVLIPQTLKSKISNSDKKLSIIPEHPLSQLFTTNENFNEYDDQVKIIFDETSKPLNGSFSGLFPQESPNSSKVSISSCSKIDVDPLEKLLPIATCFSASQPYLKPIKAKRLLPPPAENCRPFNYPKDNNINNCYSSSLEKKELGFEFEREIPAIVDIPAKVQLDTEVLEYYPAKQKAATPTKAVLRHALKHAVKFEATVNEKLTQAQESVVKQVINFWTALRYVSSPKECFDWIQAVLLNPQALSRCGNSFLKKINVIFKMIREKRFSKPFAQRYREKADYQKEQKPVKPKVQSCTELASMMSAISSSTSPDSRKTHQEQEKASRTDAFKTQIAVAQRKLKSPSIQSDETQSLYELIQVLHVRMQEEHYA